MTFRIAFLNLEQDLKRWEERRFLITQQLEKLNPDVFAMNEVSVRSQTGRWLQREASRLTGKRFALAQQSKSNGGSRIEGEGVLTRFPIVETANFDYCTHDYVALVVRMEVEERLIDVYVTHLFMSRGDESLRVFQVKSLLEWIESRGDADAQIVCGDFNASPDKPAAQLMAKTFRQTQSSPTAFSPLADVDGTISHPYWERFDRSIDYIWTRGPLECINSAVCFNEPDACDGTLWPSDHAGLWADLQWSLNPDVE
ncbi:MAG: endonuclease/exonuclease/phosphatase family metal-dependent hydrolase [Gammaproteobacteria bacterium]|jgi:endonuclease/exonuclease/phosphatase family metal-dependent hydrolase